MEILRYESDYINQPFDIHDELSRQLNELCQKLRERLPTPIHVLNTANDTVIGQIEERFREAQNCYCGKRILLIPYLMDNHHWSGILLEWNSTEQMEQSEFIDPVIGFNSVPDELQKSFMKIFPKHVLCSKIMLKDADQTKSGMLTITNLLNAVQNSHFDQSSSTLYTDQKGSETSTEGNQINFYELEKRLCSGLAKFNIPDENILSERIQRSQNRIKDYRETGRIEDAEKEMNYLKEYEKLAELAKKVKHMKQNVSELDTANLEKQLVDSLDKLRITDIKILPKRIALSEKRIEEYREEKRFDDVERETAILNEYKKLQKLANDINSRNSAGDDSGQSKLFKLNQLEQRLATGLENMKIVDPTKLLDKIARSEERIREFEDEGRIDDLEREKKYLNEYKILQKLSEEIRSLKSNDIGPTAVDELQQKLNNGLTKYKVANVKDLSEKIRRSEQRIKEYQDEGRLEETENENNYLAELNKLQKLADELDKHKATESTSSLDNFELKLRNLEKKLENDLLKLDVSNISVLPERIQRAKKRISEYQEENRVDETEKEQKYLRNLEDLSKLASEIMNLKSNSEKPSTDVLPKSTKIASEVMDIYPTSITHDIEKKKSDDVNISHQDWIDMHLCAEKTVMQLLEHFQQKNCGRNQNSSDQKFINDMLDQLGKQIQKQELFSEKIQENLQDLERYALSRNIPLILYRLTEILSQIRPLNVHEIERLVNKAKNAGKLIAGKDIILLIGETGTGKSTTIQFLSGSKMKKTKVEVESGKFLEHITIDGPIKNPDLINVTSSALSKSETRYIAPVTIPLRDIYGAYECGEIILCDAPGFGDTAGPEVDIANGVGVIEALKGCKSVKILALSSYKSLGDRGQGIQKLAHLLIKYDTWNSR